MAAFSHIHVRQAQPRTQAIFSYSQKDPGYEGAPSVPIFVNKVRRLFEGGTLLIILLSLAALKRVNTVMRISVSAEQFYSWGGGANFSLSQYFPDGTFNATLLPLVNAFLICFLLICLILK